MAGIISPNLQGPKTVKDLIKKSYLVAHVLGKGEPLTHESAIDGFESLNDVIEQAMLEKIFSHYQTEIIVPLVADKTIYTIGPATASPPPDVESVRPIEILNAFSRREDIDVPVFVTHAKLDYDGIRSKGVSSTGWSAALYYQASFPTGTVYVYPQPSDSSTQMHLTVLANVSPYTYLEEEVSVPPGYYQYLKYALAKRICAEHGLVFGEENQDILDRCTTALTSSNIKPMPVMVTGLQGLSSQSGAYDIRGDQFGW